MCGEAFEIELIFREVAQYVRTNYPMGNTAIHHPILGPSLGTLCPKSRQGLYTKTGAPFEKLMFLLLTMSKKSIVKNLSKHFRRKVDAPSASAFVQQRQKSFPAALEELFRRFTGVLQPQKTFRGFRLLGLLFCGCCWTLAVSRHCTFSLIRVTEWHCSLKLPFYFPNPHAPWQRGTNENTNGLIREYLPESFDVAVSSEVGIAGFVDKLNRRPRKC